MTVKPIRNTPDDRYPETPLEVFEYRFTLLPSLIADDHRHNMSDKAVTERLALMAEYKRKSKSPIVRT